MSIIILTQPTSRTLRSILFLSLSLIIAAISTAWADAKSRKVRTHDLSIPHYVDKSTQTKAAKINKKKVKIGDSIKGESTDAKHDKW